MYSPVQLQTILVLIIHSHIFAYAASQPINVALYALNSLLQSLRHLLRALRNTLIGAKTLIGNLGEEENLELHSLHDFLRLSVLFLDALCKSISARLVFGVAALDEALDTLANVVLQTHELALVCLQSRFNNLLHSLIHQLI